MDIDSSFIMMLQKLPVEIQLSIVRYLTPDSLIQLSSVSKELYQIAENNSSWCQFFSNTKITQKIDRVKMSIFFLKHWDDIKQEFRKFHPANDILSECVSELQTQGSETNKASYLHNKLLYTLQKGKPDIAKAVMLYSADLNQLLVTYYWKSWCSMISKVIEDDPKIIDGVLHNLIDLKIFEEKVDAFSLYSLIQHSEQRACTVLKNKKFSQIKQKLLKNHTEGDSQIKEYWAYLLALKYANFAKLAIKESIFMQSVSYLELIHLVSVHSTEFFLLFYKRLLIIDEGVEGKNLRHQFNELKKDREINRWLIKQRCSNFEQFLEKYLPENQAGLCYSLKFSSKDPTSQNIKLIWKELQSISLTISKLNNKELTSTRYFKSINP